MKAEIGRLLMWLKFGAKIRIRADVARRSFCEEGEHGYLLIRGKSQALELWAFLW
jgi:hypothetical protein